MAEGLFAARLPGWRVASAGLGALIGSPADPHAVALLQQRGVDIGAHRAQQITRTLCIEADMVLVMEREQRHRIEKLYPETCGRVFRMAEHAAMDIPDPYRKPEAAFRLALTMIEDGVSRWVHRIQRL